MKVILCTDVENLGLLGDVVEVRSGYGRNYLLPQGIAMVATPANLKVFELERKKLQVKVEAERGVANSIADKINAAKVVIPMRVGENDKLYGAVTTVIVADALQDQFGIEIDRRRVLLDAPIRLLGEYSVRIRLYAGVNAELSLSVVPDRIITEDDVAEAPAKIAEEAKNEPEQTTDAEEAVVE